MKKGKIGSGVGTHRPQGTQMLCEEYHAKLRAKGYTVDKTPQGVIISPPKKKS